MEIKLDNDVLNDQILEATKKLNLVPKDQLLGIQWDINEFHKRCCLNKSGNWVRTCIFYRYPETLIENGGFVIVPHKTPGIKGTSINAYEATRWMQDHFSEIDWSEKLAV